MGHHTNSSAHRTELFGNLIRHLPVHSSGDSAAASGRIVRVARRQRRKAPKLRHVIVRYAPLSSCALVAHQQPVRCQCRCVLFDTAPLAVRLATGRPAAHDVRTTALVDVEKVCDCSAPCQPAQCRQVERRSREIRALPTFGTEGGMVHQSAVRFWEQRFHCVDELRTHHVLSEPSDLAVLRLQALNQDEEGRHVFAQLGRFPSAIRLASILARKPGVHMHPCVGAKFPSSEVPKRKPPKLMHVRSQCASPHPASALDGNLAQNTTVWTCCGSGESRVVARKNKAKRPRGEST